MGQSDPPVASTLWLNL